MTQFATHWKILPPSQKHLWPLLHSTVDLGFVLYSGTAVALRLGHRQSIDFDFFTDKPLDKPRIRESFSFVNQAHTLQETTNSWTMLAPESVPGERAVQVSFFGGINNGRIKEPQFTDDGGLLVASLPDLMVFKVKVILHRVEAKDYQDLAAMLKNGVSLETALAGARTMFAPTFQPMESLKAMSCFDGGDLSTLSAEDKKRYWKQ
jgi:hypothetical protein